MRYVLLKERHSQINNKGTQNTKFCQLLKMTHRTKNNCTQRFYWFTPYQQNVTDKLPKMLFTKVNKNLLSFEV